MICVLYYKTQYNITIGTRCEYNFILNIRQIKIFKWKDIIILFSRMEDWNIIFNFVFYFHFLSNIVGIDGKFKVDNVENDFRS